MVSNHVLRNIDRHFAAQRKCNSVTGTAIHLNRVLIHFQSDVCIERPTVIQLFNGVYTHIYDLCRKSLNRIFQQIVCHRAREFHIFQMHLNRCRLRFTDPN